MCHEDSARDARSHQLDACAMASRAGEAPVTSDQRNLELFRKRNIDGIVGRQIVSQIPDPEQQGVVRIPIQREVCEIGERCLAALAVDFAPCREATDHVRDLDIEQMRGVQCFIAAEQPAFHGWRSRCTQ